MAFDLALSENFDLMIGGSRDALGISGDDLVSQRIKIRLRIAKGTWVLDDHGSLGSNISLVFGTPSTSVIARLPEIIMQALVDMPDIEITDVDVEQTSVHEVTAKIFWRYLPDPGEITDDLEGQLGEQETTVVLGTGGD